METIFAGDLLVQETLGQGGFGQVLLVTKASTQEQFAVKCELKDIRQFQLLREAEILRVVQGYGIPKVHSVGETEKYVYIVEELLGKNLAEHCKGSLGVGEKADILQQCISRLEFVHSRGYTHNDVKPQNFCMGLDGKTLYLTDFGLANQFEERAEKTHIDYRENVTFCGTAVYASLGVLMGVCPSRRDDLESALLIAIRLFRGKLPWEHLGLKDPQRTQVAIRELKLGISVEQLCSGLPRQLRRAFQYVRGLKFWKKPNYDLLRSFFEEIKDEAATTPLKLNTVRLQGGQNIRLVPHSTQRKYRNHSKSLPSSPFFSIKMSKSPRQPSLDDDSLRDVSADEEKTIKVAFAPAFPRTTRSLKT